MNFIMLINVEIMPTIIGILKFISMIIKIPKSLKARKVFIFQHFSFYKQLQFHAQLSFKSFITLGPVFSRSETN